MLRRAHSIQPEQPSRQRFSALYSREKCSDGGCITLAVAAEFAEPNPPPLPIPAAPNRAWSRLRAGRDSAQPANWPRTCATLHEPFRPREAPVLNLFEFSSPHVCAFTVLPADSAGSRVTLCRAEG